MLSYLRHVFAAFLLIGLVGCYDSDDGPGVFGSDGDSSSGGSAESGDSGEQAAASSSGGGGGSFSLGSVVWLDTNVSGWPQTASLNAGVSGNSMVLNYDKANVWPAKSAGGATVNANAWIFVNQGGTWYGATWEWLRPGQTSKSASSVEGGHIKKSPLNNFRPKSGETYGFMVSGLARTSTRNVEERSNVDMVRWP